MRYINQNVFTNERDAYKRYLKKRGLKLINQFNTPKFNYPSQKEMENFNTISHIWSTGDRYFKLADEYYGDSTEFHMKLGDIIYIPVPLESVLFYIGY